MKPQTVHKSGTYQEKSLTCFLRTGTTHPLCVEGERGNFYFGS